MKKLIMTKAEKKITVTKNVILGAKNYKAFSTYQPCGKCSTQTVIEFSVLWDRCYDYSHFTSEETEVLKGKVICPRSQK